MMMMMMMMIMMMIMMIMMMMLIQSFFSFHYVNVLRKHNFFECPIVVISSLIRFTVTYVIGCSDTFLILLCRCIKKT